MTPSAPSASLARAREALGGGGARREVLLADVSRSAACVARDDERVPARGRVDVHERDGALVLGRRSSRAAPRRRSCRTGSRDRGRPWRGEPTIQGPRHGRRPPDADAVRAELRGASSSSSRPSTGPRPPTASAARPSGSPRGCASTAATRASSRSARTGRTGGRSGCSPPLAGAAGAAGPPRAARWPPARSPRPASPTTSPAGAQWFRRGCCRAPDLERRRRGRRPRRRADRRGRRPPRRRALGLLFAPASGASSASASRGCSSAPDTTPPLMWPVIARPAAGRRSAACWARVRLRRAGSGACRSAPRRPSPRSACAASCRAPTTTSPASRPCSALARAAGASARSTACACCWSRPAREESFMEGMQAFARRHFASLPTDART